MKSASNKKNKDTRPASTWTRTNAVFHSSEQKGTLRLVFSLLFPRLLLSCSFSKTDSVFLHADTLELAVV